MNGSTRTKFASPTSCRVQSSNLHFRCRGAVFMFYSEITLASETVLCSSNFMVPEDLILFFLFFREEISCLKCIWHLFWSHLSLWGKWRKISAYIAFLIHHCCWHLSEIGAVHAPFISTIKIDQTSYSIQSSTFSCQICQLSEKWISPLYTGE